MNRAVVFIDNGYLSKILKKYFKEPNIDYSVFSDNICGECERLRTYVYDCMPYQSNPPTPDERTRYSKKNRFLNSLEKSPRVEVKLGKLQKIWVDGKYKFKQKMVDVLLSVDLVKLSWSKQIQDAIIVAGDRDYVPALKASKDAGVLTKIYYKQPVHDEILSICDECIEIDQDLINKSLRKKNETAELITDAL